MQIVITVYPDFDLISQSGWNTLTSAQSKVPISKNNDSATLIHICQYVERCCYKFDIERHVFCI